MTITCYDSLNKKHSALLSYENCVLKTINNTYKNTTWHTHLEVYEGKEVVLLKKITNNKPNYYKISNKIDTWQGGS